MLRPRSQLVLTTCLLFAAAGCGNDARTALGPVGSLNVVAFETQVDIPAGVDAISAVALADFTGDGTPDLAVIDAGGTLRLRVGEGNGAFMDGGGITVPADVVTARAVDLDGDTDLDLVLGSFRGNVVQVLENDGTGRLTAGATLATEPVPTSLAARDCNDDGIPDILLSHFSPSFINVYLGIGDGTFASPVALAIPSSGRSAGLKVADVTADGNADIVLAATGGNEVVIYTGSVSGLHDQVIRVPVDAGPFGTALGDLTGDGNADIVVTNVSARTIQVLSFAGGRQFDALQRVAVQGLPGFARIGDVTGDGIADLVVALIDVRSLQVYPGTGNAAAPLGLPTTYATIGFPGIPEIGDVNADGLNDLAVGGTGSGSINLYLNRGAGLGLAGIRQSGNSLDEPFSVVSADLDGDGRIEVLSGGIRVSQVVVSLASAGNIAGDPQLTEAFTVELNDAQAGAPPRHVHSMSVGDFDLDGKPDIIVAVDGGLKILHNTSSAPGDIALEVLPRDGVFAAGAGALETALMDVNGDGLPDLVASYDVDGDVKVALATTPILPGAGGGGIILPGGGLQPLFQPATSTEIPGIPGGVAVGDFDGDEIPELAVSLFSSAQIQFFEFGPGGALIPGSVEMVGAVPTRITASDFDGDGRTDLIVSNGSDASITILRAVAAGGFDRMDVAVGTNPLALLTRDLDRDGDIDILVASLTGTNLTVLLGDGDGGIAQSLTLPGVFTSVHAAFGDLNGNGLDDLVIGAYQAGRISILKNVSR